MKLRPFFLAAGSFVSLATLACGTTSAPPASLPLSAGGSAATTPLPDSALQAALRAAPRRAPMPTPDELRQLETLIDGYYQRSGSFRGYLMVDKPMYQPGETVWMRADLRASSTLALVPTSGNLRLIDPKGGQVLQATVMMQNGIAAADLALPQEAAGGEYTLELTTGHGAVIKRPIIVAAYEAPRLKKTLEMLRKAYGPGDTATAAVEIHRTTGEPFAGQKLTALVTLDDAELARLPVTTDEQGRATVRFALPKNIARGDALLTILADDAGFTESIQKRVPIVLSSLKLAAFPEGGELVTGLPGRVYVSAENLLGKPADIEADVLDDQGRRVTSFMSVRDGMGRFELTPQPGRSYKIAITKPVGIRQTFDVPAASAAGCVLTAVDDFTARAETMDIAATCTEGQTIYAVASLRDKRVASAAIDVEAQKPAVLAMPVDKGLQGAVRVTLFAAASTAKKAPINPWEPTSVATPLAERLIYRGRGQDLKIEITADKASYTPRDKVALKIKASDLAGKPVAASLGVSVVDDTVLALADDKTATIKAHLFLESELPTVTIEDPNFYFSDKPEAAAALDMVMGTKGYRRFDWQQALVPPVPAPVASMAPIEADAAAAPAAAMAEAEERPMARPRGGMPAKKEAPPARNELAKRPLADAKPADGAKRDLADAKQNVVAQAKQKVAKDLRRQAGGGRGRAGLAEAADDDAWGEDIAGGGMMVARVFPIPDYQPGYEGARTDFRETIFWAPDVRTSSDGTATVTFPTSDAVTSFRVIAEGASLGGLPGHGEALFKSELPLSLDTKLPLEVSAGDKILLPVSLTNKTDHALTAHLDTHFGAAFKLGAAPSPELTLLAGEKKTMIFPIEVVSKGGGQGEVSIAVTTAGLKDSVEKTIKVVPLGFPIEAAASGTAQKGIARHVFETSGALPGTMVASVTLYPSPLASMTRGTEAILREPSGCFEQTSSSNYPNVMAMQYMATGDVDPQIVQRAQDLMSRGYKLLAGYETPEKGYEWFGQNPGHEALTAYGLMEFEDMASVHDEVDRKMIERTASWLMSRRDGKGGFERNSRALDSFGRASAATTNGYIVWALTEAKRAAAIAKELEAQANAGLSASDPYLVALAANALLNTEPKGRGPAIAKRLAAMQDKAGHFPGAKETITMSGGESLDIETSSLAVLALIKASPNGEYEAAIRSAVAWINGKRDGYGAFGSTQGTVLALKALTRYADYSRRTSASGVATVRVNGKDVGRIAFAKGEKNALEFNDLAPALINGKNTIEIELEGEATMPYSVSLAYRSAKPASSANAKVDVITQLAKDHVALGEGVKMHAEITNRTQDGIPMTLARIGIPGGLTFQTWQLKELKDKGVIDFYETGAREIVVYLRAMAPGAHKQIDLDLLASLPGTYVAPATSAYLYYTDEDKTWTAPTAITVTK
jgi:alpha-2-macroglobulin-like protein